VARGFITRSAAPIPKNNVKTSTKQAFDATRLRPSDLASKPADYVALDIIKNGLRETRLELAQRPDSKVDWLYRLCFDTAPEVRLAVSRHNNTSLDSLIVLGRDQEAKIRAAIALPLIKGLAADFLANTGKNDLLRLKALEILAEDELAVVRRAVTEAMVQTDRWPAELVHILAQDLDRSVAEQIIISAPIIPDQVLQKIIESYPPGWVLKAIAQRRTVGSMLCSGIVRKKDHNAIEALLDNKGAKITDAVFEEIVEEARDDETLQAPLARRTDLPRDSALKLAFFAGERVLALLEEVQRIDPKSAEAIAKTVAERLRQTNQSGRYDRPIADAMALQRDGMNDDKFQDLVGQDKEVAKALLALRARVHPLLVDRIMTSESPRAMCALVWRAEFSMRSAMVVQRTLGQTDPKKLINARDGIYYPLTPDQMKWHLGFFGIDD